MRTLIIVLALMCVVGAPAAFAETRALSGFSSVSASSGVEVEIAIGQNFSVEVTGPDARYITTRVAGDELQIGRERQRGWWGNRHRDARVRVTMPRVDGLDASSGAQISAAGLSADALTLDASSGGNLNVAGACRSINADASSGAHLNATHLRCQRGSVEASSGGRADVNVSGPLDVEASSGGNVYAGGGAQIGNISLSSGGSLHRT